LNLGLFTFSRNYTWINALQLWGAGTVDLAEKVIQVTTYSHNLTEALGAMVNRTQFQSHESASLASKNLN
jgi:hypothetical protein